jgi:hypothetical protein
MAKQMFVLYDGRAKSGNDEDADVMDTADTEIQARKRGAKSWKGHDGIWFQYRLDDQENLLEGRPRWDIPPCVTQ